MANTLQLILLSSFMIVCLYGVYILLNDER